MSSLDSLSSSAFASDDLVVEPTYKSISKTAIFSLALALIGLLGFFSASMLLLPFIGLLCGWSAIRGIRNYPDEYSGQPIALVAIVACGATLICAPFYLYHVYITEVPEGYQRVEFMSLKSPYGMPDAPTQYAMDHDGEKVFLKGYIFPSSVSSARFKSFILVPDLATCCFGSQPPTTHMIKVDLKGDLVAGFALRRYNLAGTLSVDPNMRPVNGVGGIYYSLKADYVK